MKTVVAAFNQEKALVGAFSVIVQLYRWIDLRHYLGVDQLAALVAGEQVVQQHRGPAPVLAQPDLVGALPAVLLRARIIGSGMRF